MKTKSSIFNFFFLKTSFKSVIIIALLSCELTSAISSKNSFVLKSPDNSIQLSINIVDKQLTYTVSKNNIEIITPSSLGIMVDRTVLGSDVSIIGKAFFRK